MTPKYCSNCGAKSANATSKFCASCGQPLDSLIQKSFKAAKASLQGDDPDGSDVSSVPDITSLAVTTEVDNDNTDQFGKSFSFAGGNFLAAKFKPRQL